jgi:hypothetical protein
MGAWAAFPAAFLAANATCYFGMWIWRSNRLTEGKALESSPHLSEQATRWDIKHIRDDIGMIFTALTITNGLLAAILAAMIFHHS